MKKTLLIMLAMVIGMTAIAYTLQARQAKASSEVRQQTCTVSGVVKSKNGEVLPFVSIVIKERLGKGTTTDIDGKFTITCNYGETLVFKFVGYKDKEQKITNSVNNLVIELGEDTM